MKKIKHIIKLEGFNLDKGKISFSLLEKLSKQLTNLAESTMLSLIEGKGTKKRGKLPEWLEKSIDFQLTGLSKGSTILSIEAPQLSDTLAAIPQSLFNNEIKIADINNNSALGFSMMAYELALNEQYDSYILDKALLQEMLKFNDFLQTNQSEIIIGTPKLKKNYFVKRENIDKIKTIEQKTPTSIKTKMSGILDVVKHSNSQLELIIENKRIRAYLSEKIKISDVLQFFGKEVTINCIVNFLPSNQIKSIEIFSIYPSLAEDDFFKRLPLTIHEQLDIKQIVAKQNYKGTDLKNIIGQWPGEESIDELLQSINK